MAWGDYDNDGDLDILLTGDAGTPITKLYRNSGGANPTFAEVGAGLPGVAYASVAWGDYDKDGDLDILLTGSTTLSPTPSISRVYRNNGGANPTFADTGAGLTGVFSSSAAWGDYDNDGDLDILFAGYDDSFASVSRLYRNSGGANPTFSDAGAGLSGAGECSLAWADDDNDGDLDILLAGWDGTASISKVYRNNGGANPTFSDIGAGLPGADTSSVAWGDYDNDGDLDILISGNNAGTKLYRSSACEPNTPPTAPSGLTVTYTPDGRIFSWNAATDARTPAAGLTYNLRVGTTPGGNEILSGMAAASGLRRVVRPGNVNHRLQWTLKVPVVRFIYWSVQAVDGAFAGSPFAIEYTVGVPVSPDTLAAVAVGTCQPNPFSTSTRIGFHLARAAMVSVRVYDVSGRLVRRLAFERKLPAGPHHLEWDGRDERGDRVGNGAYLCSVETEGFRSSQLIIRIR